MWSTGECCFVRVRVRERESIIVEVLANVDKASLVAIGLFVFAAL
jgi:hypothetical protein